MNGIDLIEIKFSYIWIGMIGFIHGILAIVGVMSFIVLSLMKKNSKTAQYWRNIYIVSIILMIFCYILALLSKTFANNSNT